MCVWVDRVGRWGWGVRGGRTSLEAAGVGSRVEGWEAGMRMQEVGIRRVENRGCVAGTDDRDTCRDTWQGHMVGTHDKDE